VIAYTPFIDPLDLHDEWFLLLLPLALFISIAYKAVRQPDLKGYWSSVLVMTTQIVAGMVALGGAFYVFIEWLVPLLAPLPA